MPAIPIVGLGISAIKGIYDARQAGKVAGAQRGLMGSQQQLMGQQSGLANEIAGFARQQHTMAEPALSKAMSYYTQLATGNRGGIQSAIAPDVARMNETYRGAEQGLNARLAPGPGRDRQIADLYRQRAGQLGILPFQAHQSAVGSMAQMGQNRMDSAMQGYRDAGSALSGAANTAYGASATGSRWGQAQGNAADQWGQAITAGTKGASDIWDWYKKRQSGGGGGMSNWGNQYP